ncbi:MAG TPA: SRPBCC family protein [Gemmatimonadales bacterium]|nr:SRPBCC family protein [Gemmatimonadales bacterium]
MMIATTPEVPSRTRSRAGRADDDSSDRQDYRRDYGNGRRPGFLDDPERMARFLGWFSIGLGLAEVAFPRGMSRLIGVTDSDGNRTTLQAFGIREIVAGIGVLSQPRAAGWLWARAAGDALDLAALGKGLDSSDSDRGRIFAATAAVLGAAVLDVRTARQLQQQAEGASGRGVHVVQVSTIGRTPDEVYRFWRDFRNLPRFMEHLASVEVIDDRRSRWTAKAPAGGSVGWDAEIVDDRPGELIAWRTVQHADVDNRGSVRFGPAPAGRGTEVRVELSYQPPGGVLGAAVAKLFGEEPGQQVKGDLQRLKQVLETGEVVHSDASIHHGPHPARPAARRDDPMYARGGAR